MLEQVEGCLYSVPKDALTSQSPVFTGMFDGGDDHSEDEGGSDDEPIILEDCKSKDFESLLKVVLHR